MGLYWGPLFWETTIFPSFAEESDNPLCWSVVITEVSSHSWPEARKYCLEGQGDLVSRLIMGIIGVTIWDIGVMNLLTKYP